MTKIKGAQFSENRPSAGIIIAEPAQPSTACSIESRICVHVSLSHPTRSPTGEINSTNWMKFLRVDTIQSGNHNIVRQESCAFIWSTASLSVGVGALSRCMSKYCTTVLEIYWKCELEMELEIQIGNFQLLLEISNNNWKFPIIIGNFQ